MPAPPGAADQPRSCASVYRTSDRTTARPAGNQRRRQRMHACEGPLCRRSRGSVTDSDGGIRSQAPCPVIPVRVLSNWPLAKIANGSILSAPVEKSAMPTRNINLTAEQDAFVEEIVRAGK